VKRQYIADIEPNQDIEDQFLVTEKELRTARNGSAFLTLKLTDRTGRLVARVWQDAEQVDARVVTGEVATVRGRSESYRNQLQLQVRSIVMVPRAAVDPADFLPRCPLDPDRLWEDFKGLVASLGRGSLKKLMLRLLADTDLSARLRLAPAAKSIHHAYLGGLLEHSVSVARLLDRVIEHYGALDLDRDLLITGALLHDIGKIDEYRYDLAIDYSDRGRLIGHMVLGWQIVQDQIRDLQGFPERDEVLLNHLILSHHGEAAFGAVRLPMTREAFLLHYADDMDAKMHHLSRLLASDTDDHGSWTGYQNLYGRFLFKGWRSDGAAAAPACVEVSPGAGSGRQLTVWSQLREIDEPDSGPRN